MAPRAGDTVSVGIRGGICDGIFEREGYPQITREGAAIRLLEYGHHWDTDELCIYGIGTMSEPIGVFPAGNYTLTVDLIYPDFFGDPQILSIGVIPFTVMRAAPAAPVPSFRVSGLIALTLGLSSLAVWRLRGRRTSS